MPVYVKADRRVEIEDYPMGSNKRGTAVYAVETKQGKGERISRTTTCNGRTAKPKTTTYGEKCAILTCEDGLTWVATLHTYTGIYILKSNLMFSQEVISERQEPERYAQVLALIENAV